MIYYQDDLVTLYHGDCLQLTQWANADVLVTDPPYGITGGRLSKHSKTQVHDDASWDNLEIRDLALNLFGDKPRMVFGSPKKHDQAPLHRGVPLIWDKGEVPGMGDYSFPFGANYEIIWVNGQGWSGKRRGSIFRSPHLSSTAKEVGHPTPKPVGLMELLISYAPDGQIADPFAGSGATLIAARNLGRKVIGVELEERYCEITARRLSQSAFDFSDL